MCFYFFIGDAFFMIFFLFLFDRHKKMGSSSQGKHINREFNDNVLSLERKKFKTFNSQSQIMNRL